MIIIATSNIAQSIDTAFIDRADIVEHIPLPGAEAIYWILGDCIQDLRNRELIRGLKNPIPPWRDVRGVMCNGEASDKSKNVVDGDRSEATRMKAGRALKGIARECEVSCCVGVACWVGNFRDVSLLEVE